MFCFLALSAQGSSTFSFLKEMSKNYFEIIESGPSNQGPDYMQILSNGWGEESALLLKAGEFWSLKGKVTQPWRGKGDKSLGWRNPWEVAQYMNWENWSLGAALWWSLSVQEWGCLATRNPKVPPKSVQQENGSYCWTGKHWFSIPHSKDKTTEAMKWSDPLQF